MVVWNEQSKLADNTVVNDVSIYRFTEEKIYKLEIIYRNPRVK